MDFIIPDVKTSEDDNVVSDSGIFIFSMEVENSDNGGVVTGMVLVKFVSSFQTYH